jgi:hypothetical protein
MKMHLIILSLLIASACFAQEIKFTNAPWDSLAIPLDISAYYLTVDSSTKGGSVALELDLYIKGRFIRTLSAGRLPVGETKPVKANFALYLYPNNPVLIKDKIQFICVADSEARRETKKLYLLPSEFPMAEGTASAGNSTKISASGRTPVFILSAGGDSFTFTEVAEDAPKANPNASVIIAYLKTRPCP